MCSFNETLALKFSSTPKQVLAHSISNEKPDIVGHIKFCGLSQTWCHLQWASQDKTGETPHTYKKTGKIRNNFKDRRHTLQREQMKQLIPSSWYTSDGPAISFSSAL